MSATICLRSSRVSGVRSRASCSMTVRMTRSSRSCGDSVANSSGPSCAMHAWWTRVFSSAYGSVWRGLEPPFCASREESDVGSAAASCETRTGPLMRSWSPTTSSASGRGGSSCSASFFFDLLLCSAMRPFASSTIAFAKSAPGSLSDDRLATVDAERDGTVGREVGPDLRLQGTLHLGALDADVRVRAVQDDADSLARERQQLERLEAEPDVLDRRHVQPAEQQQVVGPVERRQHRPVEEGRRVDDDRVVRSLAPPRAGGRASPRSRARRPPAEAVPAARRALRDAASV